MEMGLGGRGITALCTLTKGSTQSVLLVLQRKGLHVVQMTLQSRATFSHLKWQEREEKLKCLII